jgi:hypothetical protein
MPANSSISLRTPMVSCDVHGGDSGVDTSAVQVKVIENNQVVNNIQQVWAPVIINNVENNVM